MVRTLALIVGISLLMVIGLNLFPIILFVFPLAFIVIGVKFNLRESFMGILMASLLVGIIVDPPSGIALFAIFGPMSLLIAYGIIKRKKPVEIIIPSSIIIFVLLIISFMILRNVSDVSIIDQLEETLHSYTEMQMERLEDLELTRIESFRFTEEIEELYQDILSILPSYFIIISVLISYINYYFSTLILRRLGLGIRDNPQLSEFSLPKNFILGTLIMFITIYLLNRLDGFPARMIHLNILFLVVVLFLIQGLSVLDYQLKKRRVNSIIRIIVIAIIIFAPLTISIMVIVGMVDLIFDFRKLRKRRV